VLDLFLHHLLDIEGIQENVMKDQIVLMAELNAVIAPILIAQVAVDIVAQVAVIVAVDNVISKISSFVFCKL
jgi:hypothetical protein